MWYNRLSEGVTVDWTSPSPLTLKEKGMSIEWLRDLEKLQEFYDEGVRAFYYGDVNPYLQGSDEHDEWELGYSSAEQDPDANDDW